MPSIDPVTAIVNGVRLWMVYRPIRMLRNRRRAKRGLPLLTDEEAMKGEMLNVVATNAAGEVVHEFVREEPVVNARTSTKTGGTALAVPVVAVLGLLPFYDQVSAFVAEVCMQPRPLDFVVALGIGWAVTAVPMYLTARKTKSPLEPKGL